MVSTTRRKAASDLLAAAATPVAAPGTPVRRNRKVSASSAPPAADTASSARSPATKTATQKSPKTAPDAAPIVPRGRGRPRKTADAIDDGNRRRALMDGAAQLFLKQGFAATSTRDIAAAVGMHSGSPFYHFKSKSDLLFAVMSEGMTQALHTQQQAMEQLAPGASPLQTLHALVRQHFEVLLGPRSGFIPVMLYEWRSLTPAQRKGISRIKDAYEAVWMPSLQALAQQGRLQADPGVARLFIFGALNWTVQWFAPKKGLSLDALTQQAVALFIHDAQEA